jgi:hypothetical protein
MPYIQFTDPYLLIGVIRSDKMVNSSLCKKKEKKTFNHWNENSRSGAQIQTVVKPHQ